MASSIEQLKRENAASLEFIRTFRQEFRSGKRSRKDFSELKHKYPYVGLVKCKTRRHEFYLFHAADDIVAWEYLWLGTNCYEPDIVDQWERWSASAATVLDVGSYTGLMSILACLSNPRARCDVVEPMERTIERAKVNLVANGLMRRITLHNFAASDSNGTEEINLFRQENFLGTGNSLYDKGKQVIAKKSIFTRRLDDVFPEKQFDLVKIDVEGHEASCLEGMKAIVARSRPNMIIEVWEHNRKTVLRFLESLNYRYRPFEDPSRRVVNYACEPA
jgi:FkbM family methyltransferase